MPAVISYQPSPVRFVSSEAPTSLGRLTSALYPILFVAFALFGIVRIAARWPQSGWAALRTPARRDARKDYRRNPLASPSGLATGEKPRPLVPKPRPAPRPPGPPAMEASRAVSVHAADDISPFLSPLAEEAERELSPPPASRSDGADAEGSTMDRASWLVAHAGDEGRDDLGSAPAAAAAAAGRSSGLLDFTTPRQFMARPPPPPPLTPPSLTTGAFPFENRRPSYAVSIPGELETLSPVSFIHHPNPDYMASSSGADVASSSSTPRRRSYTKMLPLGIPSASSTTEESLGVAKDSFAPSSFPSASPLLPPPPPSNEEEVLLQDDSDAAREIDLLGEIISVLDDSGAGWKRHTRVYGGGVCLACLAAGGGGFYGDKVPLEDRR